MRYSDAIYPLADGLKLIDKAEVVSFDIFDTLLIRPLVEPHHLFWLIEPKARELLNDPLMDFHMLRKQAERNVRDIGYKAGKEDVTLDEIYSEFQKLAPNASDISVEEIKAFELDTERRFCSPNPTVEPLFEYAVKKSKRIIITTDMYLPSSFIKTLLKRHHFDKYEKLYVSNELGKTKHMGSLYKHILEDLGVKASSILHIGDNAHADIKKASRNGLTTFHVEKPIDNFLSHHYCKDVWGDHAKHIDNLGKSLILGTLANKSVVYRKSNQPDFNPLLMDWEHFGYYLVGPLYLGFTSWLLQESAARGVDQLLFLARDGKIMKEVYDRLAPIYGHKAQSSYLQVSRRATQIPRLKDGLDSAGLDYLCASDLGNPRPLHEYFTRLDLGFDPQKDKEKILSFGFNDLDELINSKEKLEKLKNCFLGFETDIKAKAQTEYNALMQHFEEEKAVTKTKKRKAVVDIGWHGSMLFTMQSLIGETNNPLTGFFFGTYGAVDKIRNEGLPVASYIIDGQHPHYFFETIHSCVEIVELLFTASEGSVLRMEKQSDGTLGAVRDTTENHPKRLEAVRRMQDGALAFIDDVTPVLQTRPIYSFTKEFAFRPLETLLLEPTQEETELFDQITHIQNIGTHDLNRQIVPKPNIKWLFFKPRQFGQQYRSAYWRKGFEARMGRFSRRYMQFLVGIAMKARKFKHRFTSL